jgi:hypothetical protein
MVPVLAQINHDLGFLYAIARLYLPKDILEELMYGDGYDEPSEEDFDILRRLIEANKERINAG